MFPVSLLYPVVLLISKILTLKVKTMDKNQIHPSATLILADMGLKRSLEGGNSAGTSPDGSTEVCPNHQCNPRRYYEFIIIIIIIANYETYPPGAGVGGPTVH